MTPFWHPMSGLFLVDPPMPATRAVLSMFLAAGPVEVVYGGDRMFPAVRPGQRVTLDRTGDAPPALGEVVAAVDGKVVDLFRVTALGGGRTGLAADADPGDPLPSDAAAVVARARVALSLPSRSRRRRRRYRLDLEEAWTGRPDAEAASSVLEKYESQAVHYARTEGERLEPRLEARIRAAVPAGGRLVILGSGAGKETIALASVGYRVRGIDFAPTMVAASREAAARAGVDAAFVAADLRYHDEPPGSADAVLFTYDVYSFLPGSASRIAALRRIATWLTPGGRVYLSARRLRGLWARIVLLIQRLRGAPELGDSHTRWFDAAGGVRRSYVHVFPDRALRREIGAAGGRWVAWEGGHGEIVFGETR